MRRLLGVFALGLSSLFGCTSLSDTEVAVPAELKDVSPETRAALLAALGAALGRQNVSFGPGLEAGAHRVTVLPPPLGPHETRSPSLPEQFELTLLADQCQAVRISTGAVIALPNVACHPISE